MIQLTKGTNVLDINLSDFSGAGQDVVQNGSFTDIGSDLILNGDFAEIGSDLVTNGDFSAVPLSGELILDGDFPLPNVNWQVLPTATINGGSATIQGLGSLTSTGNNWGVAQDVTGHAVGKSYKVTFTAKQLTGVGVMYGGIGYVNQFSQVITSEYVTYTFYQTSTTSGTNWDEVAFGGILATGGEVTNTFEIKDVSVKEVINLVSNPNFTDTGAEEITNGDFSAGSTSWTVDTGGTDTVTFATNQCQIISDGVSGATGIVQSGALTSDKSYKVTIDVASNSNKFKIILGGGSIEVTGTGVQTFYGVAAGGDFYIYRISGQAVDVVLNSVSVKELGADWQDYGDPLDVASFNENGLTITSYNTVENTNRVVQPGIIAPNKSYKVTYTIHSANLTGVNNVLQYFNGVTYIDMPTAIIGTPQTLYYTTLSTLANFSWYFRLHNPDGSTTDTVTISSILIQELGEGWTVSAEGGISFNASGLSLDSSKIDTSGGGLVYGSCSQTATIFELGKSYKLVIENLDITSGSIELKWGRNFNSTPQREILTSVDNGTYTDYFTAVSTADSFTINSAGGTVATLRSISVQEVGQDWTVTNSDSTQYVEFFGGVGGARIVVPDAATTPILTLTANGITLLAGKHYKLVVDVTVVTGSVKYDVTGTTILYDETEVKTAYFTPASNVGLSFYRASSNVDVTFNSVIIQQLDTNGRWVTFADPDSKSVLKLGQVDLEIDSSGNNCGVYQTGLIKPNKLYIITINMKATAVLNVEIAASLGTTVSAVIGTTALTTSYVEYSFEYVTPFAVDHDLQIHRLLGSGDSETISIDYVSMNGVDENQWVNDPTWNPFATSLVFVPTLTDESTNNSKQFTLDTSIADGGWDGRSLHGQVIINESPTEDPANGEINLEQPDFLEGFYQVEIRGYLGTFYRILGKGMAHLERASTEDGYNRFEAYNDSVTYKAYEE